MRKIICLLFILSVNLYFTGAYVKAAGDSEIELKSMSPALIQVEPGKTLTLSIVAINHSGLERNFAEEVDLPADWQVIIPTTSFKLGAYDQQVRLLSLVVPANAPPGSYRIDYALTSRDGRGNIYRTAIDVEVIAISALKSIVEEKPRIVISGDTYTVKLRYMNQGNSRLNLGFDLTNTPDYSVKFAPEEMSLEPGASQVLTITVKTNETLSKAIRHVINVKAIDKKTMITGRSDTILTDVIPTVVGDFYHRIPSKTKLITGVEGKEGDAALNSGVQLEFVGSGNIDEEGKQRVDLSFMTPNPLGEDFSQNTPNFNFRYANDLLDLTAGNRNMYLSTLTKRWSGYDNIRLDFHPASHRFGLINPDKDETGFYYGYQFADWLGIRANYLQGGGDSAAENLYGHEDLYSLQAEIRPLANTTMNLEYANMDGEADGNYDAYRVHMRGIVNNSFYYSLDRIQAEPDFFGAYNDLESTNGTLSFLLYNKLQTTFTFHNYRNNLDFDPTKDIARNERTYFTNLSYYFTPKTALLLSLRDARKTDRLAPAEYDHEERLLKLGFQHQFPKWRVQAYAGAGEYADYRGGGPAIDFTTYNLNLNYTPNSRRTYLFFINTGDEKYAKIPEINNAVGVKANLQLTDDLDLNLEYQNRYFLLDSPARDYMAVDFTYTNNRLSLALRTSQSDMEDYSSRRWFLFGSYLLPYNMPVSKRKEISAIKGRVFRGEDHEQVPLSNVVVKASGMTAVTNEAGEFSFTALPAGTYWLSIDQSQAGLDLTAIKELPLAVEVKKGETVQLMLGMVPAAEVRGKTLLVIPEQQQAGDEMVVAGDKAYNLGEKGKPRGKRDYAGSGQESQKPKALANTLIEFTNGAETFRQVTNSRGEFSFPRMRPGQWTLKAYDNSLPAHFYFEFAEAPLDLKPGETREFIFEAIPKIRTIQIVEEGSIGSEGSMVSSVSPVSPSHLLDLESLFEVEYYSNTTPSKSPWASLEQVGAVRQNYVDHARYYTDIVYIVKKGETLVGIADKFQVSLERLITTNYLQATGKVQANSVLIIPIPVEFIHLVKSHETLEEIAENYGTTVEVLIDLNSIGTSDQLVPGQPLVLPGR